MAGDIASLGIRIDSSQAASAATNLDRLADSADRAAASESNLAQSAADAADATKQSAAAAADAAANYSRGDTAIKSASAGVAQFAQSVRATAPNLGTLSDVADENRKIFADLKTELFGAAAPIEEVGTAAEATAASLIPLAIGIGAVVAVTAVLVKAFAAGQAESYELYKSIVLSGNAAGVTTGQLALMAVQMDRISGTRAQASQALGLAVGTGKIAADQLQQVSALAIKLQQVAGTPLQETIKQFASLGDKPSQAAEALNKQYNFLTVSIDNQIRALEREGNVAGATALAQKTLADEMDKRTADLQVHLGLIPRAWNAITGAAKEAWDAMLGLGRQQTPEEELQKLLAARAGRTVAPLRGNGPATENPRIGELRAQIAARNSAAAAAAKQAEDLQTSITNRATTQIQQAAAGQTAAANLQANLSTIKRVLDASVSAFTSADNVLEAQRKAHLVSETEYYDARRSLIEADRVVRVKALEDENKLLAAESERLRQSGGLAAAQTNDQNDALKAVLAVQPQIIANEEKRKANLAEIARLNVDAASKTAVANIAEVKENADVVRGYEDARKAAEAYIDTLARRQKLELEGVGAGNRQREINSSRSDIEADFQRRREALERDLRRGDITQKQFDTYIDIEKDALDRSLKQNDDYYKKLAEKQADWSLGALEALHNYVDEAQNTAGQVSDALSKGLNSATDALVNFVKTGKLDFKSLVDSILADLLRIQLQKSIASILSSAIGYAFGAFGGSTPTGAGTPGLGGGTVQVAASGTNYVQKDNSPFLLHKGEAVIPAAYNPWAGGKSMNSGDSVTVNSTLNVAAGTNVAEFHAAMEQNNAQLEARIYNNFKRNRWSFA